MHLLKVINIPFGYCRVNQKYIIDITDFLLVEIVLCILIIIMAKGIFEVKLSKLQFVINQTEEAEKYINDAKEDFAQKSELLKKAQKPLSRKPFYQERNPSISSEIDFRSLDLSFNSNVLVEETKSSTTSNELSDLNLSWKSLLDGQSLQSSLAGLKCSGSMVSGSLLPDNKTERPVKSDRSFGALTVLLNPSNDIRDQQNTNSSKSVPQVPNSGWENMDSQHDSTGEFGILQNPESGAKSQVCNSGDENVEHLENSADQSPPIQKHHKEVWLGHGDKKDK